jgi:hypothetical protein
VAGVILCALGAFLNPDQFLRSYLAAFLLWMGVALGCISALMLYHLAGGNWGFISRRLFESGARTIPYMLLLILPIAFGVQSLYEWARPGSEAHNVVIRAKYPYLNVPFFYIRLIIYFAIWSGLSYLLNRLSAEQDRTADPALKNRMKAISGPGMVVHGFVITFAVVDWVMSLQPEWYSTIFGMIFIVGQMLSTLSLTVAMLMLLSQTPPFSEKLKPQHFHDLGNLMLAFVILWAYMSFSQFLLIWSGNLPEENTWYLRRLYHGWGFVAVLLVLLHFAIPFILLLMRYVKRKAELLTGVAVLMILMRMVDLYWNVEPVYHPDYLYFHWLDVVAPIAMGGIWMWIFLWQLKSRPLLPLHDDRIEVKY